MTQNTEQNVRTRDEQAQWMARCIKASGDRPSLEGFLREHILQAEARGAEERRRKDVEASDEALDEVMVERDNAEEFIRKFAERVLGHRVEWSSSYGFGSAFIDVADRVDALEAEIASLKEAEQLSRADAEASKARVTVLEVALAEAASALEQVTDGERGGYNARNGKFVSLQMSDGERADIIHSDVTTECEGALAIVRAALTREGGV